MLALELEARELGAKVKRAGVKAQNAGCVMSKAQGLIDALVAHHNGETIIPKLTSFEGTKKSRSYDGDGTCRAPDDVAGAARGGGGTPVWVARRNRS